MMKFHYLLSCFLVGMMTLQAQILFQDNFESADFMDSYDMTADQNFEHIANGSYDGSGCVEVTVVEGTHYGGSMRYLLMENLGYEPEELYAEYRVRYDQDMETYGGKAPGFSGTYDKAGWGNEPGYGVDGWSARGTINCDNQDWVNNRYYIYHTYTNYDAPVQEGTTDWRNYNPLAYDVSNPGSQPHASENTWASGLDWGDWDTRGNGSMEFDQWYHVKQYIKLNDVGQNNGILRAWVDGELVCDVTNINFRRVESLKIYAYWFNYYNGGSDVARATGHVRLDDFKLYIQEGPAIDVTGLSIAPESKTIEATESFTITPSIEPANASNKNVTWSSSDTQIATVTGGVVTGVSAGQAVITAETVDGSYKATCAVEVTPSTKSELELLPTQDAYMQGSSPYDNTYLKVEAGSRVSYLQFSLPALSGELTKAQLVMTCDGDAGSGELNIYKGISNNWTEENIASSNVPSKGALLGSSDGSYNKGTKYTWDLDVDQITGGTTISLIVEQASGNDPWFASKDHTNAAYRPVLILEINNEEVVTTLDKEFADVNIYPNPFTETLTIEVGNVDVTDVKVYDVAGNLVLTQALEGASQIALSPALASGVYFVQLSGLDQKLFRVVKL